MPRYLHEVKQLKTSIVQYNGDECVYISDLPHFDMKQIMDSGQCFRIREIPATDGDTARSFSVCHTYHHVKVDEMRNAGEFRFHCTAGSFHNIWFRYFDLGNDCYEKVRKVLDEHPDPFLEKALQYGGGIRILNQGFLEALLCFMTSQNNNIKRITDSVDAMCKKYGHRRVDRGVEYYALPIPLTLLDGNFEELGLGYREAYFRELFSKENFGWYNAWHDRVLRAFYPESKKVLMEAKGIGSKVADCICLYGLHQLEAYPVDTWMKKIIADVYDGHFDPTVFGDCAGYVQQLQFYYYRSMAKSA